MVAGSIATISDNIAGLSPYLIYLEDSRQHIASAKKSIEGVTNKTLQNRIMAQHDAIIIAGTYNYLAKLINGPTATIKELNEGTKYQVRAERMKECGENKYNGGCKTNLCPNCKSRQNTARMKLISPRVKSALQNENITAVYLTFTLPKVADENIKPTITHLQKSYQKFYRKKIKPFSKGILRSTETENNRPHLHAIILINKQDKTNFTGDDKVISESFLEAWQAATGDSLAGVYLEPIVGSNLASAVTRIAGYITKNPNYLQPTTESYPLEKLPQLIKTLSDATANQKLIVMTGLFQKQRN